MKSLKEILGGMTKKLALSLGGFHAPSYSSYVEQSRALLEKGYVSVDVSYLCYIPANKVEEFNNEEPFIEMNARKEHQRLYSNDKIVKEQLLKRRTGVLANSQPHSRLALYRIKDKLRDYEGIDDKFIEGEFDKFRLLYKGEKSNV